MRISEHGRELYERILVHAKECAFCRPLVRGSQEPSSILHRLGCVTAVILTTEWCEEYGRLHSPQEQQAIADFGESVGIKDVPWRRGRG